MQQLQEEVTNVKQQQVEQTEHSTNELNSMSDAKAALQQTLDKALLDLEASALGQADLTEEVNQWKGKVAKLQKVNTCTPVDTQTESEF